MVKQIIFMHAKWCAPCKALAATLKQVTEVPIEEYDVDDNEELCEKYHIRNVPILIFLNDKNEELGRSVGNISLDSFYNKLKELNEK